MIKFDSAYVEIFETSRVVSNPENTVCPIPRDKCDSGHENVLDKYSDFFKADSFCFWESFIN
jgi:hypothetical protein